MCEHRCRPSIDARGKTAKMLELSQNNPFHVRIHSLGLTPTTMSKISDLRDPKERAAEIVNSIIDDPPQARHDLFSREFS